MRAQWWYMFTMRRIISFWISKKQQHYSNNRNQRPNIVNYLVLHFEEQQWQSHCRQNGYSIDNCLSKPTQISRHTVACHVAQENRARTQHCEYFDRRNKDADTTFSNSQMHTPIQLKFKTLIGCPKVNLSIKFEVNLITIPRAMNNFTRN